MSRDSHLEPSLSLRSSYRSCGLLQRLSRDTHIGAHVCLSRRPLSSPPRSHETAWWPYHHSVAVSLGGAVPCDRRGRCASTIICYITVGFACLGISLVLYQQRQQLLSNDERTWQGRQIIRRAFPKALKNPEKEENTQWQSIKRRTTGCWKKEGEEKIPRRLQSSILRRGDWCLHWRRAVNICAANCDVTDTILQARDPSHVVSGV